jgi:hypothetical protein
MIVSKDTNPAKDLYYTGGLILERLIKNSVKKITYYNLVSILKNEYNLSTNIITLSLDWLYVIGCIDRDVDGDISICF